MDMQTKTSTLSEAKAQLEDTFKQWYVPVIADFYIAHGELEYIVLLSKVIAETISEHKEIKERTRKWAYNQYLAFQQSRGKGKHIHKITHLESQSVYWAQNLLMEDKDSDELAEQWLYRNFQPDFEERTLGYLVKAKAKAAMVKLPQPRAYSQQRLSFIRRGAHRVL
ncbi:hypothetical protein B0T14DRAFT_604129 [Immersiella caudata]|uniref:Uncharacterized protein n=1 Tax=Immersiella caudata TaxID=314043 RepID=A0AA40C0Y4_9PEZI|nr:hypothetical protein B0T14DRAFT_604129 [Immersiella caudata]